MEKFACKEETAAIMLDRHKGMLHKIVNTYCYRKRDFEDLYQEAEIALVKSLDTFDESYGNKFLTYAVKCIKHRIFSCLRSEMRHSRMVNESDLPSGDIAYDGGLSSYEHPFDDIDDVEEYIEIKKLLTKRELDVLEMRINGLTLENVGVKYGFTREWARLEEKKTLSKIEKYRKITNRCIYT